MKNILFILFVVIGFYSSAQKVHNFRTDYDKKKFTIKYDILGVEDQLCSVRLFISFDDGQTFDKEITDATGDIGDKVEVGKKKKIEWVASSEDINAEKVKFSLQVMAIGLPPKKKKK